jgi:uncharacterized repeat protein (TIGR01451 family)
VKSGSNRRPRVLALVFALVLAVIGPVPAASAAEAPVTINASGGGSGAPGLRIIYGNGEFQVVRNGDGEFSAPGDVPEAVPGTIANGIVMNVGGVTVAPWDFIDGDNIVAWASATQSGGSGSGDGTITGTLTSPEIGGHTYQVAVTITYVDPSDTFNVSLDVTVPEGATEDVRLYLYFDTHLAGGENGQGSYTADPVQTVGVFKTAGTDGVAMTISNAAGPNWSGYYSGDWKCPRRIDPVCGGPIDQPTGNWMGRGEDFNGYLADHHAVDNGIGVSWNLGSSSTLVGVDVSFSTFPVAALTKTFSQPSIDLGDTVNLTYTVTNDAGLGEKREFGFTDVLPTGLTFAGIWTNNCAGQVTAPEGTSAFQFGGPNTTALLAEGQASCTITIPVTASAAGTYTSLASVVGTSGPLRNAATNQGLTVVGPPPPPPPPPPPVNFTDVSGQALTTAVNWMVSNGITAGCQLGANPKFCPNDPATRAQVATFLTRAFNLPATSQNKFNDDNGHPLEQFINRAAVAGLFSGCTTTGQFCPDRTMTRAELATVLVRAYNLSTNLPSPFVDVIGHWSKPFVDVFGGLKISSGCNPQGTHYCPDRTVTRGEIALLMYKVAHLPS